LRVPYFFFLNRWIVTGITAGSLKWRTLRMSAYVVVLNGGSSSGKTTIGRCLQELLPDPWLLLGVDDLLAAMPQGQDDSIITFAPDGGIFVGPGFRRLEAAWYHGIAAMARSGVGVIVDEVFLGGGDAQARLRAALSGLDVLWVGVHCDPGVAAAREAARPDRVPGMAAAQAEAVHQGVNYDVEVDTTSLSALDCAQRIKARVV
jgi:chloramphenicol 3-O phosphotransferase